jgi:hypothetical protein
MALSQNNDNDDHLVVVSSSPSDNFQDKISHGKSLSKNKKIQWNLDTSNLNP